ncbi:LEG3 protein, partial [Amia calva]|nr:LEG3 protein [Amia calva]
MNLPRGIYDKMLLTIDGEVKPNGQKFIIDFKRGKDIVFHLNPRLNDEGKKTIVRNSMIGNWGQEERHLTAQFPFVQGKPFQMKILCTPTEYRVAVNKAHILEFKHRLKELASINEVSIYGDVTLKSVNLETLP